MKTYTQHKLTDAQLIRLSQMVNGRPHKYGMALVALVNKKLVDETINFDLNAYGFKRHTSTTYSINDEGREAFRAARAGGW